MVDVTDKCKSIEDGRFSKHTLIFG